LVQLLLIIQSTKVNDAKRSKVSPAAENSHTVNMNTQQVPIFNNCNLGGCNIIIGNNAMNLMPSTASALNSGFIQVQRPPLLDIPQNRPMISKE